MNLQQTIRANIRLSCSVRLRGSNLNVTHGVTEELERDYLTLLLPSAAGNQLLQVATNIFVAVDLPFTGITEPRVLECSAAVVQARPLVHQTRIIAEVQRMTVISRDPGMLYGRRTPVRLPANTLVPATTRWHDVYPAISSNRISEFRNKQGKNKMSFIKNMLVEEDGQDMVEYGLVLALVVLGTVAVVTTFGSTISGALTTVGAKVVLNLK